MTVHGGDARLIADELGISPSDLLDFSANINPRGLPRLAMERLREEVSDQQLLTLYPDRTARRLRYSLSKYLDVPVEAIGVGPGAEALLAPVLRCLRGSRALVPHPAFSEYRRVCAQLEMEFVPFGLQRDACFRLPVEDFCNKIDSEKFDVVVLNNPHNPTGAALNAEEVSRVLETVGAQGGTLVLDEAFVDYAPEMSLTSKASFRNNLIVVRSLTKFYGCPALRVGYAVARPERIDAIVSYLPAWPISQLAIDVFAEAVRDQEYAQTSRTENAIAGERLRASLTALGLTVFPTAANYLLFELGEAMPAAADLRERLIRRHRILVRNCDSYEGLAHGRYVRVAVRSAEENGRLLRALDKELQ